MGQARRAREAARGNGKVIIGNVHGGTYSAAFANSLVRLLMYDVATSRSLAGFLNVWSSANISTARNNVVGQFLDHDSQAEWLLFIDSDMQFEHTAVEQLLAVADPETVPIVGGLCFGALHDELFPTIYHLTELESGGFSTIRVLDYPKDALIRCTATGAAFLLIHRSALEAIRGHGFNRTFPWFQETENAGQPVGEDITFCLRAGLLGIPVHVNAAVKVGHHKSTLLTEERFLSQRSADAGPDPDA